MNFEKFKKMFDESFGKVSSKEFIQRMENLGYKFKIQEPKKELLCKCPSGRQRWYNPNEMLPEIKCKKCGKQIIH